MAIYISGCVKGLLTDSWVVNIVPLVVYGPMVSWMLDLFLIGGLWLWQVRKESDTNRNRKNY